MLYITKMIIFIVFLTTITALQYIYNIHLDVILQLIGQYQMKALMGPRENNSWPHALRCKLAANWSILNESTYVP